MTWARGNLARQDAKNCSVSSPCASPSGIGTTPPMAGIRSNMAAKPARRRLRSWSGSPAVNGARRNTRMPSPSACWATAAASQSTLLAPCCLAAASPPSFASAVSSTRAHTAAGGPDHEPSGCRRRTDTKNACPEKAVLVAAKAARPAVKKSGSVAKVMFSPSAATARSPRPIDRGRAPLQCRPRRRPCRGACRTTAWPAARSRLPSRQ